MEFKENGEINKVKLSVVILTKNEEKRITDCINSVLGWVDEIIIVDDESSDNTREIAEKLGAKVLVKKMVVEGTHRNWAYSQGENEWVLSIDADERVTEELKLELCELLNASPECNAYTIPRRNFIRDYWIRWGGQYPAAQIKLIRKGKFSWEEAEVHPQAFVDGKCGHLKYDLIHYTYRDWADFLKKLNYQTTLEARKWYKLSSEDPKKARYKMNFIHALWRTGDRFFRAYFAKQGFRDGFIGFMAAYFSSLYQMVSYAKYRDIVQQEGKKALG